LGCSSNKGKIEGTKWSSLPGTVKGQNLPEGVLGLEFGADKKLVYTVGLQRFTGTYSLGMGSNVTLHLEQELPGTGRKDHVEKVTIDGDKLTMTDSDGTTLNFKKLK
jgi:hypothetical protein